MEGLQNISQSQAIKASIHAYYLHLQEEQMTKKSPAMIFKKSGYLGSFKGDKNLSTNYKKVLTKCLKKKYDKK